VVEAEQLIQPNGALVVVAAVPVAQLAKAVEAAILF